ncbi:T9SS C-terminal target domain-containing protein [candidate division KSB1 bacterium]|nr:T9SS type A sorting domain-containing protein [candidate division KSB1 bacterium]RQW07401.1 MAG: T9SS C-terminal target domain-containing protein [candidate division KSB1 bacterium]
MRKWLLFLILMFVGYVLHAQDESILWQDSFDDEEEFPLTDVGWFFYCDGTIPGNEVKQLDGQLYIKSGNFENRAAVGIAQTNGVYFIELEKCEQPTSESIEDIIADDYSSPNQELTFQVKLKTITSSIFLVGTRAILDPSQVSADPQQSPAYVILSNPLESKIGIARYDEPGAAFDPTTWTYFAPLVDFTFEMDVYYSYKLYLSEGDMKLKVWKGALEEEPTEWLLEGVDPDPRVSGHSTIFALFGQQTGDEIYIDNVTMRQPGGSTVQKKHPVFENMDLALQQNFPNPFNPSTEITYLVEKAGLVTLDVYNQRGRRIRQLVSTQQQAGRYNVEWNGTDDFGLVQPSGIYYVRLCCDERSEMIKMTFLK